MFTHFEVESFSSSEQRSNNPNALSRFRNLIIRAFNALCRLPRLIIIVFEDDLLQMITMDEYGISDAYKVMLKWLIREINRSITIIRDKIPKKALKEDWPHVLFLAPTVHKNYNNDKYHRKFTHCLENEVRESNNSDNLSVLRFPKLSWDPDNGNLYLKEQRRHTSDGIGSFWQAVDRS